MGRRLERRMKAANPYASNPSTWERDRTARRREREADEAAQRRANHRAEVHGSRWKPRWPW